MNKVLSVFLIGGALLLFGAATGSPVLPPSNGLDELQEILGRLRQDQNHLNEVLKKLEKDEAQLQKYLASKGANLKLDVK